MSNRAQIEVRDYPQYEAWEVVISDDYASGTITLLEKPPDDDIELVRLLNTNGHEVREVDDILNFVQEHEKGMYIRDTWYPWEKLYKAFE